MIDEYQTLFEIMSASLRLAVPLIFAALGGLMSERSGVINIALEGFMLLGAFFGVTGALAFGSPWIGLAMAVASGMVGAMVYGILVIGGGGNQIVAGTGFNLLAVGLTPLLCKLSFGTTNGSPSLPLEQRFVIAPVYMALILPLLVQLFLRFTRAGLWLDFAGAGPKALKTQGLKVAQWRWLGVILSGAFAALGGATLTIYLSSAFARNISAGRGFIALAALIMGRWQPILTLMCCLLFGFADAVQMRLQGSEMLGRLFPVQIIQILPYVLTLMVLARLAGRSQAPKALGEPLP